MNLSMVNKNGISRQTVSDWENGNCEPKLNNIRDLAKVLEVSFDALLDDDIDLNDKAVLNSVLHHLSSEKKEKVNNYFRYRIVCNNESNICRTVTNKRLQKISCKYVFLS